MFHPENSSLKCHATQLKNKKKKKKKENNVGIHNTECRWRAFGFWVLYKPTNDHLSPQVISQQENNTT